jgi:hypothetical protein
LTEKEQSMTNTGASDRGYFSVHGPEAGLTVGQLTNVVEGAAPASTVEVVISLEDGNSRPVSRADLAIDGLLLRVADAGADKSASFAAERLLRVLTEAAPDDAVWLESADGEFRIRLKAAMANDEGTEVGLYLYRDEIS